MTDEKKAKPAIDSKLNKFFSRKLLIFAFTTLFFCLGMLPPDYWITIAIVYIGSQSAVNIVSTIKGKFV